MTKSLSVNIVLTHHARIETQQRVIRHEAIVTAHFCGHPHHAKGQEIACYLGCNEIVIFRYLEYRIGDHANVTIPITKDNPSSEIVITIQHASAPSKYWRPLKPGRGQ
jgi:hypothetical protein